MRAEMARLLTTKDELGGPAFPDDQGYRRGARNDRRSFAGPELWAEMPNPGRVMGQRLRAFSKILDFLDHENEIDVDWIPCFSEPRRRAGAAVRALALRAGLAAL